MEIDLTHGSQLVYVIPDTMLTISDFYRNIQISILARGYEGWRNGEANILITRGLVGRLSNTPNVGFAYEVQHVVDYLASHGVRALPRRRYDTRELMGQNWIITPSTVTVSLQPTEAARTPSPPRYNLRDYEEEEEQIHTVAVLTLDEEEEEVFYIKKIRQALLSTGISIKTPEGTYARIAPRSSYAIKGIIIGAGVVDSDYRECSDSLSEKDGQLLLRRRTQGASEDYAQNLQRKWADIKSYKNEDRKPYYRISGCYYWAINNKTPTSSDGSMEGWGGICKWKLKKYDSNSAEKICAYSSGKYNPLKSTIDAEIHAVMNNRGSLITDQGQTQFDGIPTPSGPYELNMKNWPAIREEQVSTTKKNTTNALIWPTLSGQQSSTSLAALESLSLSASSRNQISAKEATSKDGTPTGKRPYQLSMKQGLNYSKYSSTCNALHSS
ncbi:hypothetical protein ZIOFF_002139 [Zingiber officinale]|uniref:dUTP diphosphatase n=1 Tax=Zingiber officinale TaxID=94328 RepID=A0A8J5LYV9_ZINOF|nr:hypothetical protein ZIOFF_002139 [Zingiber officinale]